MNPLKKIYCRIFQTAFKLALPLLPYRNPKILGSVKEIPALLEKKNCNTVLLITDGGIRKLGLTERLEKALADAGIPCIVYDRTVANPCLLYTSPSPGGRCGSHSIFPRRLPDQWLR